MPSNSNDPAPKRPKPAGAPLGEALSLGTELAAAMLLGVVGGRWADQKLSTSPMMLLIGVAVGFAAGLYLLVRGGKQTPPDRR